MVVSDAERRRMAVVARDLAAIETEEAPSGEALAQAIARANADRAARGLPPLLDEHVPEEELYIRARALGLSRIRG
jgi:hypothetical protein